MSKMLSKNSELIALHSGFFEKFYDILIVKMSGNAVESTRLDHFSMRVFKILVLPQGLLEQIMSM